ncbi:MAG: tetratricopeptide repeat protein [Elusimicrobia bacterium]|nr:tetratricopeptide repeat protein [Elusimicrobiota bacterium]
MDRWISLSLLVVVFGVSCGWGAEERAVSRFEQTITLHMGRTDPLPETLLKLAEEAGDEAQRLRTLYTAAEIHWKNQAWDKAAELYERVAREGKAIDPYLVHCAQLRLAETRLRTQRPEQAIGIAQDLTHVASPFVAREASLLLIRAELAQGHREEAHTALEAYVTRYPQDQDLALIDVLAGLIAYDRGDFATAIKHFQKHPDDATALYALLATHCAQQQFPQAIAAYQQLTNQ